MSHTATGNSSTDPGASPTAIVPDDGDAGSASSVDSPFQALLNGIAWLRAHAVIQSTALTNITPSSGSADGTAPPKYYKDGAGRVHLLGSINNPAALTTLFTLPTGCRPAAQRRLLATAFMTGAYFGGTTVPGYYSNQPINLQNAYYLVNVLVGTDGAVQISYIDNLGGATITKLFLDDLDFLGEA